MFRKLTIKGNYYEIGYQLGNLFKQAINDNISIYEEKLKNKFILDDIDKSILNVKTRLPNCFEELKGKAEGACVDFKPLFLMHSPEVLDKVDGCTTAIFKKQNSVLFSHNEDDKGYDHKNTALVKIIKDNGDWLVSLAAYDKLVGSCFGYNNYGLVFSCNFIYHDSVDTNLLSRYLVIRDVAESKNIDECIKKLNDMPTASPFSFNVLEKDTLKVINIENDYDNHNITNIDYKYARSNHFLTKDNPKMSISSKNRNLNAKNRISMLDDNSSIDDLINVLSLENKDSNDCILKDPNKFSDPKVALTICNFSYDGESNLIIINDYIDHTVLKMGYEEFE